jgi:zinc protease
MKTMTVTVIGLARRAGRKAELEHRAEVALATVISLVCGVCACAGGKHELKEGGAAGSPTQDEDQAVAAAAQKQGENPQTPDAEFRASKPMSLPLDVTFDAPVPAQLKLKNGARLLVVENHAVPLVGVDVVILTGSDGDPLDKAGLAGFVAAMMSEGTKKRSALQLAADIENLAATLTVNADRELTRIHLNALKETLPDALDILADVLENPAFAKDDLERTRGLLLTALLQKAGNPALLARDEANRILFGDKHPLGQPTGGTPKSLKAINGGDLRKFHETYFRPNHAIIGVSGDVGAAEVQGLLDARLARWKSKPVPARKLPALPKLDRAVVIVDKPGASQSQVWVIDRLFGATDPDAVPLTTANNVLGGLFGSRLNLNLRENKAFSYGVRSSANLLRATGFLAATGGVKADVTAEALAEYEKELQQFSTGDINDEEAAKAREAAVRILPSQLETNDAVSGAITNLAALGLPMDWYKMLPERIAKLTTADLNAVAKKHVRPDRMPIVIVGPKDQAEAKIKAMNLGKLETKTAVAN